MAVTIKDIAKLSNVSVSTVSRVLNNHKSVSPEVRARVHEVIAQQNFVPHEGAVELSRPRQNTIGIIIRGNGNMFFAELIPALGREIEKAGYSYLIRQIGEREDEFSAASLLRKEKNLIGLILRGGRFGFTSNDTSKIKVPFVCCSFQNKFSEMPEDEYSSVCIDDVKMASDAVKYLVSCGHRRIAMITSAIEDSSISELRHLGYKKGLLESGIEYDEALVVTSGSFKMIDAYNACDSLVKSGKDFSAIFTIADTMAIAIIRALKDNGLSVPDDISVVGVDGISSTLYSIPSLTTMKQPIDIMSKKTVDILDTIIKSSGQNSHIIVEAQLREGESVRLIK